jgi:hypothetical protein
MMNESSQPSADGGRRAVSAALAQRIFSLAPVTWDEIEALLPSLNRGEAVRHLSGIRDDRERAALFDALFAYHPGLRTVLRPEEPLPQPPTVFVFRRQQSTTAGQGTPLRAAAREAPKMSETVRFRCDGPYELTLFPSSRHEGQHVVSFTSTVPPGAATLYVDGEPLEWIRTPDGQGRGFLASADLADVLNGSANLEMVVESADDLTDNESGT